MAGRCRRRTAPRTTAISSIWRATFLRPRPMRRISKTELGGDRMLKFIGALGALFVGGAVIAAEESSPPNFSPTRETAWIAMNQDFIAVPGGPSPTTNDPK